ncbi:tRNA (guanosine(37)-N1)-methyltransferase TrmD [Candidatus Dependentiae bacterium]|nr:tRNA (guanosine(37)-N1)-methyltransferase TrmD [Candidatus Dependentiae bacterium]
MKVSIVTLFPELYHAFLKTSLIQKAVEKQLLSFNLTSVFDYVEPKERVDAPTFGHSAGMLLRPDVLEKAFEKQDEVFGKSFKIFLSPQGKRLTQTTSKQLWSRIQNHEHIMFVASRYEGIDARVEEIYADEIVSVGDFVVMGGDVPAMLLMECLFRHVPNVVGKHESVLLDSFSGAFVDHPEYTKPVMWKNKKVPEILRSGNHAAIASWRKEQAVKLTTQKHFDWLRSHWLTKHDKQLVRACIPNHYVVLMHDEIVLKGGRVGTTSVTSMDIHDIARSSTTYNLKNYFIVTPLIDQQKIVSTILDFWKDQQVGGEYNKHRHEALDIVVLKSNLQAVLDQIEQQEGKKPIIIGTSACFDQHEEKIISYHDQEKVWVHDRPVLLLLGTGHGMAQQLLEKCDYFLQPLHGFSDFNHLSVRSAAAIIFDKWLGFDVRS